MTTLWSVLLGVASLLPGASPEIAIHGQIVDPAGAAIAGASVRLLDQASRRTIDSAVSDKDGRFSIAEMAVSDYLLAVSAPGFRERLIPVEPSQSGVSALPALRLEVLDCDAPRVNCDIFTAAPSTGPHPVILTRDLTASANQGVDLQKGELVPPDSASADIRLDAAAGALFVVPLHGAGFTATGAEGSCGKSRDKDPLRIDGLGPASEIVVFTGHKQCSRLFLTSEIPPGADQASFHVVTRSR